MGKSLPPAVSAAKKPTRQARSRLHVRVSKCRRRIASAWRGKISPDASVALAVFLQRLHATLLQEAARDHAHLVSPAHVQRAIESNAWLRTQGLLRGAVLGVPGGDDEKE